MQGAAACNELQGTHDKQRPAVVSLNFNDKFYVDFLQDFNCCFICNGSLFYFFICLRKGFALITNKITEQVSFICMLN